MSERWLPVAGFEGLYEVSDLGRVRCLERSVRGRWPTPVTYPSVILKGELNSAGYRRVGLWRGSKCSRRFVHTLVLEAFVGPRPRGLIARHWPDATKTNNASVNLSWTTRRQNQLDYLGTL